MKSKTGTKEWAEINCNIQMGCEHGCRYCYARHNAVHRFRICKAEDWIKPVINRKEVEKNYAIHNTQNAILIMFPSTHDITPSNLGDCLIVLNKLLVAGNNVLIVSKPHWECITAICDAFKPQTPDPRPQTPDPRPQTPDYRPQIEFRFSIGSASDDVLKFWEPGAPSFEERIGCLSYAFNSGYKTSVSCEPYLDAWPAHVYQACIDHVTESIWFGKLRHFGQRVDTTKIDPENYKKYVAPMKLLLSDKFVMALYQLMKDWPLVKWKDSIREVIEKSQE
jgi:hypothetical protein